MARVGQLGLAWLRPSCAAGGLSGRPCRPRPRACRRSLRRILALRVLLGLGCAPIGVRSPRRRGGHAPPPAPVGLAPCWLRPPPPLAAGSPLPCRGAAFLGLALAPPTLSLRLLYGVLGVRVPLLPALLLPLALLRLLRLPSPARGAVGGLRCCAPPRLLHLGGAMLAAAKPPPMVGCAPPPLGSLVLRCASPLPWCRWRASDLGGLLQGQGVNRRLCRRCYRSPCPGIAAERAVVRGIGHLWPCPTQNRI